MMVSSLNIIRSLPLYIIVIIKKIVQELVETHISDDTQEDTKLKKQIANVNIGLLEKGVTTAQKSVLFKDLREAQLYQYMYGGRLILSNSSRRKKMMIMLMIVMMIVILIAMKKKKRQMKTQKTKENITF